MSRLPTHPPGIGDSANIGDCRSAARVSRKGSVDRLCWPRFDRRSLRDPAVGGRFEVRPTARGHTTRRNAGNTTALETALHGADGTLGLVDLVPVSSEDDRHRAPVPGREILRAIEGLEGAVDVEIRKEARPDCGRRHPRVIGFSHVVSGATRGGFCRVAEA